MTWSSWITEEVKECHCFPFFVISTLFFMQVDLSWKNADIFVDTWELLTIGTVTNRKIREALMRIMPLTTSTIVKINDKDIRQDWHVRALSYKSFRMTNRLRVLWIDWAPPVFLRDGRLLTMCSFALADKAAYQVQERSLIFLLRCQPYHYDELQPSQLHTFPFPRQRQGICFLSIGMSSMVSK